MSYLKFKTFQSTLPPRGVTSVVTAIFNNVVISIHTPTKGSDKNAVILVAGLAISIHTPTKGSDQEQFYLNLFL